MDQRRVGSFLVAGSVLLFAGQALAQCTTSKDASLVQQAPVLGRQHRAAAGCQDDVIPVTQLGKGLPLALANIVITATWLWLAR